MNFESLSLIKTYCEKCGCILTQDNVGYILRDGKRERSMLSAENLISEATKLNRIHKLEEKSNDKDFRIRRKAKSRLYYMENIV